MNENLSPTPIIDSDHTAIIDYANDKTNGHRGEIDRAVALYYAVRDDLRYDPYRLDLTPVGMRASTTLGQSYGWCVSKAVLLVACCRAIGIASRLGFADVRNHLSTERMRQAMQTDVFYWHGYASLYLQQRWVKATPAFNRELCDKFGIHPLEFNGRDDSLYHPFDKSGQQHMEYLRNRGEFADLPLAELNRDLREKYPVLLAQTEGDFNRDVDDETSST